MKFLEIAQLSGWIFLLLFYVFSCYFQFSIIEFDAETFRILLDYLHTSSCPITCATVPGLICAAEHYDLPELLQACFHHTKQFLRLDVVSEFISTYIFKNPEIVFLYVSSSPTDLHLDPWETGEAMWWNSCLSVEEGQYFLRE